MTPAPADIPPCPACGRAMLPWRIDPAAETVLKCVGSDCRETRPLGWRGDNPAKPLSEKEIVAAKSRPLEFTIRPDKPFLDLQIQVNAIAVERGRLLATIEQLTAERDALRELVERAETNQ